MSYIEIKKLDFKYDDNVLFQNITFNIDKNTLICITTPSNKGKTTLLNILGGNIKTKNMIFIEGKKLTNKHQIIDNDIKFFCSTIIEELKFICDDIKLIKKYLKDTGLKDYINTSPSNLNYFQIQKLNLIKALLTNDKIILIDNIFSYMDKYSKIEFFGLLKKYQYENDVTFIYATNDLENMIFCDKVVVIDKKVIYDGKIENIYTNSEILKKSRINVPLENELVEKLKLYNVINNVTFTTEEVVDEICKLN